MLRLIPSVRTILNAGAALGALTAMPALAQDAPADATTAEEEAAPGEIVVTARRREESLLDVPIAVTAYSGAQLEAAGAIDVTDIAATTPNVTLEVSRGTNNTLSAFIRGVGQQDPVAGFEAGVGIYLDDVYLNRPQAAVMDIYDVERIEVLRGPQGTLYGRNTIGGAVKYVTKRLGDTPTLKLRGTYGSYDQADGVISGSLPIGDGTVRIGAAAARLSRGGFGTNLTTGLENYNKDIWAARGTIEIVPSDEAFVRITGDYTKDKSNPRGGHRLIPSLATGAPVLGNVYDSRGGLVAPTQDVEAWGFSGLLEFRPAEWLTFRAITGYRKDDSSTPIDFDALPAVDVDVPAFYNNEQLSQEIQFLIDTGNFNGLIGGYWLDAKARTVFDVRTPGTVTALTYGEVETKTGAIFGDFTYDIGMFSLSVGGRYTWDRRESIVQRNVYLGSSPFFGGTTAPILRQTNFRGKADFSKFTPRASISFKPTEDHTIYASYSKGFKGGGFDPRGVGISAPDLNGNGVGGLGGDQDDIYNFLSFEPETVDSYELGWKASLFDRRLTFAFAGFYAEYKDVQVPGSVGVTVGGITTFAGITTNAGKAEFKGLEFEGNLVAARDFGTAGGTLNLGWTLGYLDAKYKQFIDARGIDVADRRAIQNTPDWTASGTIAYTAPVGDGSVNFNTTLSYRGDSQQFELQTPGLDQPGYALWDANLVWDINDTFSIGVHGRNLTDKRYIVAGYNFLRQNLDTGQFILANGQPGISSTLGAEGVLTAYYGNPRQVFVSGTVKF
ncbi:TonB-dependent receptor [Sphingomonas sp. BT-65]|uniref:TonB-dependent receptor n=1 Tax=Sphingomonas sp. BT-65 TaxID=2989821 RepID=UPI0022365C1F|nr:TonB-dependent receptor [Sphingomonas sp. BT-65]MCW4462529.1 TonB-dependent receptor [Sphingomonas sp. BT-65]